MKKPDLVCQFIAQCFLSPADRIRHAGLTVLDGDVLLADGSFVLPPTYAARRESDLAVHGRSLTSDANFGLDDDEGLPHDDAPDQVMLATSSHELAHADDDADDDADADEAASIRSMLKIGASDSVASFTKQQLGTGGELSARRRRGGMRRNSHQVREASLVAFRMAEQQRKQDAVYNMQRLNPTSDPSQLSAMGSNLSDGGDDFSRGDESDCDEDGPDCLRTFGADPAGHSLEEQAMTGGSDQMTSPLAMQMMIGKV